ncbi:glycosyltransferase family 2 protein [Plantactinospora sp. KLBMP9567]|uniref:glycosyltransferase family 2 protein n=1 Tax=Plantactinospora sp. KLBMP9567 TaxID=3085900 RepID=UPI002981FD12|nr:glycosyltransferase family 2 protein [Plantactinospora sp. KLBMP9567]MDW5323440.1 glycosyltransferase family 2 protein [Plantactinospora sp. KLBMP9567]
MVTSVVVAAHDEAAVLGRTLRTLLADAEPGEFEVVVVANGCTDTTAAVARSVPGVVVRELPEPGKPAALNAGDEAVRGFPRIYLDADITLDTAGARALAAAVAAPGILAAAPRRRLDTTGRPLLVRAYYAINRRHPAYRNALFGRGAIALSATGRARFGRFPDVVADDLFLDGQFTEAEKREVAGVATVVATPRRTADLLRRLGRVRAGNASLRAADDQVRRARRTSWLVDVVLPRPWLLPAGVCYVGLTLLAAGAARRPAVRDRWGRDESSRAPGPAEADGVTGAAP